MSYTFNSIAIIHSPFKEKFGIPRQPSLVPAARLTVELLPPYNQPDAVRGLAEFSHIWLTFVFHQTAHKTWQPLVRPPRLGGNIKAGVFATRSTHRPNPIGLSLVELLNVSTTNGKVILTIGGADLLDGTPVLDIKPYIPFIESQPQARAGFVDGPPPLLEVRWASNARQQLASLPCPPERLEALIEQVVAQDPRPAYQNDPIRLYGIRLYDYDVRFRINHNTATIVEIHLLA